MARFGSITGRLTRRITSRRPVAGSGQFHQGRPQGRVSPVDLIEQQGPTGQAIQQIRRFTAAAAAAAAAEQVRTIRPQ